MSERPIIFSAPMVKAIMSGSKSQTRRILKPQPNALNGGKPLNDGRGSYSVEGGWKRLPYAVGDKLWVREKLQFFGEPGGLARLMHEPLHYAADENPPGNPGPAITTFPDDWRLPRRSGEYIPSIHMPRWASRITLEVTEVRVQRLQEISFLDAEQEGVQCDMSPRTFIDHYRNLWNRLHGPDAWEANPWVAAITFRRVE